MKEWLRSMHRYLNPGSLGTLTFLYVLGFVLTLVICFEIVVRNSVPDIFSGGILSAIVGAIINARGIEHGVQTQNGNHTP